MSTMSVRGGAPGKIVVTLEGVAFEVDGHLDLYTALYRLAEQVTAYVPPPAVSVVLDAPLEVIPEPEVAVDPFPPEPEPYVETSTYTKRKAVKS